jgi:myosin heavy chain 9/10/11/14
LEAENQRLQESNDNLLTQKRQLEADIEELEESRSKGGNFSSDDRRLLESKIAQLEEELEEEQGNAELAQDKRRKAEQQVTCEKRKRRTRNAYFRLRV